MSDNLYKNEDITLIELSDRLLNKGIVALDSPTVSMADINLIHEGLKLLESAIELLYEGNDYGL